MKTKNTWQLKPKILTHPNIPKPLHGINPRIIMGDEWWDEERKIVYAKYDYHCVACGVHKNNAKKHKSLEAHENYDIDYKEGLVKIHSIEPLCHYCHNFIHSGRLHMILGKQKNLQEVKDILEHGFEILAKNNLKCFDYTLGLANKLDCKTFGVENYDGAESMASWQKWRLNFNGKDYYSKFNSYEEWYKFYNK